MPTKNELTERLARAEAEIARLRAMDRAPQIRIPSDLVALVVQEIGDRALAEQEHFYCVALNARQKVLKCACVAIGSVAQVDVHPRELFRDAIRICAHSVVLAHNHPSGDPEPSAADVDLTTRMVKAGMLLGIPVLDHVIVTPSGAWASMSARGLV